MNPEQILLLFTNLSPLLLVKILVLIGLIVYVVFATICLRQIDLMNKVIEAQISPFLRMVGLIHLGVAIFVFLLALFLL